MFKPTKLKEKHSSYKIGETKFYEHKEKHEPSFGTYPGKSPSHVKFKHEEGAKWVNGLGKEFSEESRRLSKHKK